ncbi:RNA polymerase II subunit A C-terminal domain phosphatase SSU72 [Trichinella britovi]|uniref:RNA polymerase II subunit A C-terminal domain phosphatase SSU72 n=1 Tax=Trichinella britovi TaxID=45882 RepID=A0A0V1CTF4_TRIBR|nr:RNA polymerase II subunit A C-terminal domain phosphatase SSU72 [Trichinella britovi]
MNKSKNSSENEVSKGKLRFSVVCSSNMNRSMEAHAMLQKKGFNVKLPGPSPTVHNIYSFSTPYEEIYQDLVAKDKNLYTQNGLLNMLDRNRRVKPHPERFQEYKGLSDVIICCEERVYDQVYECNWFHRFFEFRLLLMNTEMKHCHLVHIINIDIRDNHEEATCGALLFCHLCTLLEKSADLDNEIEEILSNFENICKRTILHTLELKRNSVLPACKQRLLLILFYGKILSRWKEFVMKQHNYSFFLKLLQHFARLFQIFLDISIRIRYE